MQAEKTAIDEGAPSVFDRRSDASVNDLKQQAKKRAAEKNAAQEKPTKNDKSYDHER